MPMFAGASVGPAPSWGSGSVTPMSDHPVPAPDIPEGRTIKGPASYFRSIERTYGQPMQFWLDLAAERIQAGEPHMAVVDRLKSEHAMGHGHANAVVAYVRAHLPG